MFGMTMYTDLFAGDLKKLADKIPYLKEQKLTYLHLMSLLDMPHPNNDGGYAVRDFDTVDPKLGTNEELAAYFGTPEAPECYMLYNVSIMVNLWGRAHQPRRAPAQEPDRQARLAARKLLVRDSECDGHRPPTIRVPAHPFVISTVSSAPP